MAIDESSGIDKDSGTNTGSGPLPGPGVGQSRLWAAHGLGPWFDPGTGTALPAYVIAIAGGSASGKTTLAAEIVNRLGSGPAVAVVSQDAFYRALTVSPSLWHAFCILQSLAVHPIES